MTIWQSGAAVEPVREESVLTAGQTVVTFAVIVVDATLEAYVSGPSVSGKLLREPEDYALTNASTITLTETYPAGTTVIGFNEAVGAVAGIPPIVEEVVLASAQTVVNFATVPVDAQIEVSASGADVGSKLLREPEDYTITSATSITLVDSYPAGTAIIGVN